MKHGILSCSALGIFSAARVFAQDLPAEPPAEPPAEGIEAPPPSAPPAEPRVAAPTPFAADASPLPAPPPPAAPAEVVNPVEPVTAREVAVGKEGFWRPGVVAQMWAFATHSERKWQQTSFRIRRIEMKWAGEIVPNRVGYTLVIDPARLLEPNTSSVAVKNDDGQTIGTAEVSQPAGATSIIQDAVVTVLSDYADVSIGQFKIPVSYDAFSSVAKLVFPERSTVARRLGERRDLGIKAEKRWKYVGYVAAVVNGEGQNRLDTNDQKDFALRLEVYPVEGLAVAGAGYTSVGQRNLPQTKDRTEADLRYEAGGLLVRGEYLRGRDRTSETTRVTSQGFYGVLGYTFADAVQPIVRVGYFDPDVRNHDQAKADFAALDEQREYSFGLTYFLQAHDAKFQLATSVFDYDQAPTQVTTILACQVSF